MSESINLESIRRDGGTQSRAGMNGPVVYEYADLMKSGVEFPSITVFHDGEFYWLADGYHRHAAAVEAGLQSIKADVRQGTQRDAVLYSLGPANREHGLQLTREDKRRRVQSLLSDPEWLNWSDRTIAKHCGVSHTFVAQQRSLTGNVASERLTADGRTMNTAGINGSRHWGLTNGMAFWQKVMILGLDKLAIIAQLQKGAKVLTDLNCTRDEAYVSLNRIALERIKDRFPPDSVLKHVTGKFGKLRSYDPIGPVVLDFVTGMEAIWSTSHCTLSSEAEWKAATNQQTPKPQASPVSDLPERQVEFLQALVTGQPPVKNAATRMALREKGLINGEDDWTAILITEDGANWLRKNDLLPNNTFRYARSEQQQATIPLEFQIGDVVSVPSGHEGTVVNINGRLVDVETTNGIHSFNRAFLTLVEHPDDNRQPREWAYESEDIQELIPSLERVLDFGEGLTEPNPVLKEDIRRLVLWLDGMEEILDEELNGKTVRALEVSE